MKMKPFTTIAIPHQDILEGRLTEDIFAADLWDVFRNRGPEDYRNSYVFFKKTFLTSGMKNLLNVAEKRLKGLGGDPVIQLQTPFGGGKTHSLIALYHKAKEWKVNVVVIDGTALDPREETLWGEIEKQLSGKIDRFNGLVSPGREKLRLLFEAKQPLLILMDEILHYTVKAAGVKVQDSTLAAQVLAFIHELTDVIKSLDKSLLVLTLPSSLLEHYDENAEKLFQQIQKIIGRMEKVYTPVQDEEVSSIIRKRLFSNVDEKEAKENIEEFLEYVEKEGILPKSIEISNYRERFLKSYPFQPEVIDVLYQRWGSFVTFQRTRGVLRLLSLVVHSLKDSKNPFIRLGDFDLANEEIRRELIKHIGPQFDSVIAADITGSDAGCKKVDKNLGGAYLAYHFGTKIARAIFLYSFSGIGRGGATLTEIKLSCAEIGTPSSIIVEALSKLKESLFYLQFNDRIYFSDQPNLNLILLTRMENISDDDLKVEERKVLEDILTKKYFEIYIWPQNTKDIPDTKALKLIILNNQNKEKCREFLERCGEHPRVNRNTMIFICPSDSERPSFNDFLRRKMAWEMIEKDESIGLTPQQRKEVAKEIETNKREIKRKLRDLYRFIYLPSKDDFKEFNLGISTVGVSINLDKEVMEKLKSEKEIVEKLDPLVIKEKYLKHKDYVNVKNICETFYKTPGEVRISSDDLLRECIRNGIKEGLFGLGTLDDGKPVCRHFKEDFTPKLVEEEILINAQLCLPQKVLTEEEFESYLRKLEEVSSESALEKISKEIPWESLSSEQKTNLEAKIAAKREEFGRLPKPEYKGITLLLNVPSGKLSDVVRIVNYIKSKFRKVGVKVEISAEEGNMTEEEYKEKIEEAINQSQIEIEREEIK